MLNKSFYSLSTQTWLVKGNPRQYSRGLTNQSEGNWIEGRFDDSWWIFIS